MAYVKSLIAGFAGGLFAAVLWIVVPACVAIVSSIFTTMSTGSGGIGFVVAVPTSASALIAALVGFIVAFVWYLRRSRRTTV
jgi:hypothetical protein